MIPDPNCNCDQCKVTRGEKILGPLMDVHYAAAMMEAYKELHEKFLALSNEIDWPVCTDPGERKASFLRFMDSRPSSDEWATYYAGLCIHMEYLLWNHSPKDTTKV